MPESNVFSVKSENMKDKKNWPIISSQNQIMLKTIGIEGINRIGIIGININVGN